MLDTESVRVGFRHIEIKDNVVTLNGKRLIIRGINRHEHNYCTGRVMKRDDMIREILLMKCLNFNAVRTSHYPNCALWYELCSQYGLCVVCETNLETHGLYSDLTNVPDWAESFLERARHMAQTFKNEPCIVAWSLGNESDIGPNHAAMAGWLRDFDPTRWVQYERGDSGKEITDIRCPMYPSVE